MKKPQRILLIITGIFVCLLIGVFIGRNFTGTYVAINNGNQEHTTATSGEATTSDGRVDINSATIQQLQLLPGIGETIAQRILDYRTENGDFKSIEDLLQVNGIGQAKLEQMRPYIKVTINN